MSTQRIIEIGSTLDNARANLTARQTFMLTAADSETGAIAGNFASGDGTDILLYAVQAKVNQSSGTVEFPPLKLGEVTTPKITATEDTDIGTYKNGFSGDINTFDGRIEFNFDNTTRIASVSFNDQSDFDFWVKGKRFIIPDGDPRLTAPAITYGYDGWLVFYFDDDGQFKFAGGDLFSTFFITKCVVVASYYSPTNKGIPSSLNYDGAEIASTWQYHGADSIDWRVNHHLTERSKITLGSFIPSTTSTGSVPTSIVNMSSGIVCDEDIILAYSAFDGSTSVITSTWPVYYYDGLNTNGRPSVHRGEKTTLNYNQIYVTDTEAGVVGAVGNIIYTDVTYDGGGNVTNTEVKSVPDNYFVLYHFIVSCGVFAHNAIIAGQEIYISREEALRNLNTDIGNYYVSSELLSESVHVFSVLLDHSGNIVPVNDDGLMYADVREECERTTIGADGQILVANGSGKHYETSAIEVDSSIIRNTFQLENLAGNENYVLFLTNTGIVGAFDIFGQTVGGGSYDVEETCGSTILTNGNETDTKDIGLSHSLSSDITRVFIDYSLNVDIFSSTDGLKVEVYKNAALIDSIVFSGVWGEGVVFERTISPGNLLSTDVITVKACPNKKFQSCTINSGTLHTTGVTGTGTGSTAYFIEAINGFGQNTTLNGTPKMPELPTSTVGLATGDLWNDSGIVKVI